MHKFSPATATLAEAMAIGQREILLPVLGKHLKDLRKGLRASREQISIRLEALNAPLGGSTLAQYEKGTVWAPDPAVLWGLSVIYKVPLEDFVRLLLDDRNVAEGRPTVNAVVYEKRKRSDGMLPSSGTLTATTGRGVPIDPARAVNGDAAEVTDGATPAVPDRADFRAAIQSLEEAAVRFDRAASFLDNYAAGLVITEGKAEEARDPGPGDRKKSRSRRR